MNAEITLETLAARVLDLEDHLEIQQLMATHPLAIDGGAAAFWLSHWADEGRVDRLADPERHSGDFEGTYGKEPMLAEIESPELEELRMAGLAHITSPAKIVVEGDRAVATNYLQLMAQEGSGYRVRRIIISRWDLVRRDGRWQITKRTIRPIGHPEARDLTLSATDPSAVTAT